MPRHRYRVTQPLQWMRGGHPGPDLTWIGGVAIVHQPGDLIAVDDREVPAVAHCLEAIDDAGRAVLDRAGAAAAAPATRKMFADFHPKDRAWLIRARDEKLRQQGRIQDLVVGMLGRGEEPTFDDLAAAVGETPDAPIPRVLVDYVAKVLRGERRRRPGPKKPTRTTWSDLADSRVLPVRIRESPPRA